MKSIIELREEAIEKDINLEVLEYRMLEEKDQEIERLNKDNGDITKLFAKEREETKRLHSIINELREYIGLTDEDREYLGIYDVNGIGILNILDKVEENK